MHLRAVQRFVGIPGAAGMQDGRPLQCFRLAGYIRRALLRQCPRTHIQDARRFVRPLQKRSRLYEPPTFIAQQGCVTKTDQVQRTVFDLLEKFAGTLLPDPPRVRSFNKPVEPVQLFPELNRDLVANHAGVFAGLANGRDEGIGVLALEHEKFCDGLAGGFFVELEKLLFVTGRLHNRQPVLCEPFLIEVPEIEEQLQVHVHNARDVLGAFDVTRHPVKRIGNARKHDSFISV